MAKPIARNPLNQRWAPPDSPRVPHGNLNPNEYCDGVGKTTPAPGTTLPSGENKYAKDGLTQDWFATHPRPEVVKS
jgi:hypothetical protein